MKRNFKKIMIFLGLTFLINWGMVAIYKALNGEYSGSSAMIFGTVYMMIPMLVAIVVQKYIYKEPVKKPLGISFEINRWFIIAWLIFPIIAFATFGVSLLLPGIEYSHDMAGMFERYRNLISPEQLELMKSQAATAPIHPIWLNLITGLFAGCTINALFAFGEELGWRGFLQREFSYLGFWKSSFVIGTIWGIWHAPLILMGHNYPQHPIAGVFMMTLTGVLLSPIFSYIRIKSKSVIAAAIAHGTLNGVYGLAITLIKGGNDLTTGIFGLPGIIVLCAINLMLLIYVHFVVKGDVISISTVDC